MTRDTVIGETPLSLATSLIVTFVGFSVTAISWDQYHKSREIPTRLPLTWSMVMCYRYHNHQDPDEGSCTCVSESKPGHTASSRPSRCSR